jgi:hypothetical protein
MRSRRADAASGSAQVEGEGIAFALICCGRPGRPLLGH